VTRGLLGQQVESQFPDLPAEVTGIWLAEVLGALGEQADEEVHAAEVTVIESGQPGADLGLDLHPVQPAHASHAICIRCYSQVGRRSFPGAARVSAHLAVSGAGCGERNGAEVVSNVERGGDEGARAHEMHVSDPSRKSRSWRSIQVPRTNDMLI
jgi:hypothetical protein